MFLQGDISTKTTQMQHMSIHLNNTQHSKLAQQRLDTIETAKTAKTLKYKNQSVVLKTYGIPF